MRAFRPRRFDRSGRAGDQGWLHRWGLVLAYMVATLLAQGAHDHGALGRASATRVELPSDGSAPRLQVSHVPNTDHTPSACAACQFRAVHHAGPAAAPASFCLIVAEYHPSSYLPIRQVSAARPASRSPPRV